MGTAGALTHYVVVGVTFCISREECRDLSLEPHLLCIEMRMRFTQIAKFCQFSCIIVYYTEEKTPFGRIDRTPLEYCLSVYLSIQKLVVGLGLDYIIENNMSILCLIRQANYC